MRKHRSEVVAVIGIGIVGVIVSMIQTIVDIAATPSDTAFPLVHNYAQDYYYYLHLMRQGFDGAWLATSKLTPEQFPAQFINPFFLGLGHLSRITNITLAQTYLLARIMGAFSLIALSYMLALLVYPRSSVKRIIALILVIFGSYWWGWGTQGPTVPSLVHLWTELDPMVRLSFIPHHLWSKVFMLATFLLILRSWGNTVGWKWVALIALGTALAGFFSPVVLVTMIPTLALLTVFFAADSIMEKKSILWRAYVPIIASIMIGILVAFYHRRVELGVFPWTSYKPWEDAVRFSIRPIDYLQSLGPTFLLFLIALKPLWHSRAGKLILAWAASGWIMAFGVGKFLPLWNIRFLEGYQFIPIAIGASVGLLMAAGRLDTLFRIQYSLVILLSLLLIHAGGAITASVNEHYQYLANDIHNSIIYVPVTTLEALTFLGKQTSRDAVILAPFDIGSMIPAYSSLRVVGGHNLMTLNALEKRAFIDRFNSFTNPDAIIKQLQSFPIVYLWRPKYVTFPYETIDGITKVFDNGAVTIYRMSQ